MTAPITRTIDVTPTPEELAASFAGLFDDEQARFFAEVGRIAQSWPGAGWCMQSCRIAAHLDKTGREVVETLAGHLNKEPA